MAEFHGILPFLKLTEGVGGMGGWAKWEVAKTIG